MSKMDTRSGAVLHNKGMSASESAHHLVVTVVTTPRHVGTHPTGGDQQNDVGPLVISVADHVADRGNDQRLDAGTPMGVPTFRRERDLYKDK